MLIWGCAIVNDCCRLGGSIRSNVLHGLATCGRHVNIIWTAVKASFETANGLTGFSKAPHYHLVKCASNTRVAAVYSSPGNSAVVRVCSGHSGAMIDPNYVKPAEDGPVTGKPRRTLTTEDDLVRFEGPKWEAFRDTSHDQLTHVAVRCCC